MNSSSIVAINRIISVGTSIASVPPAQRDFKNCVFIWKGTKKGANRINYVGTDTQALLFDVAFECKYVFGFPKYTF